MAFRLFFFQKFRSIVKDDVNQHVTNVLDKEANPGETNITKIVLIPKQQGADQLKQFRPISLCNVTMRIISKVITNRLKLILP